MALIPPPNDYASPNQYDLDYKNCRSDSRNDITALMTPIHPRDINDANHAANLITQAQREIRYLWKRLCVAELMVPIAAMPQQAAMGSATTVMSISTNKKLLLLSSPSPK